MGAHSTAGVSNLGARMNTPGYPAEPVKAALGATGSGR